MKKIITIILILLLFPATFTLKDYSEIEQIAITSAIFIELDNSGYTVTAKILKQYDEENESATATGKDFNECIDNINSTLVKKLSLSHCSVTVISAKTDSKFLGDILTSLKDYNQFPLNSSIVFADGFDNFVEKDNDYSLSEYLINNNHNYPLYVVLRNAYKNSHINLPLIALHKNGYEIIDFIDKEVLF